MIATDDCQLSVILPCANERDNLAPLIEELENELLGLNLKFEVLVVDDGSTDDGLDVLRSLQASRPWLRVFQHRRNFGQSACYCTGFRQARGELVLTMDADRQHDPTDIKRMLGAMRSRKNPWTRLRSSISGTKWSRRSPWT